MPFKCYLCPRSLGQGALQSGFGEVQVALSLDAGELIVLIVQCSSRHVVRKGRVPLVEQAFVLVGEPLALIGEVLPFVRELLALVCQPLALVSGGIPQVRTVRGRASFGVAASHGDLLPGARTRAQAG